MTISLNNSVVPADAPIGTTIGTLSCSLSGQVQYRIIYSSGLPVAVSGSNLTTAWSGTIPAGSYLLAMYARSSGISIDLGFPIVMVIGASSKPSKIVGDPSSVYDQPLSKGV